MHIAGVLVQTRPEHIPQVRTRLDDIDGLEVHAVSPDGRIVVTVEGDGRKSVADTLFSLNAMQGVLSACLVYEHSETESITGGVT
ncbi:MAG TPA: chaperone NapD [Acidiferrobacterales bacterium]|nr:chaperone NapD [Acidiferrobacterales bacterium]